MKRDGASFLLNRMNIQNQTIFAATAKEGQPTGMKTCKCDLCGKKMPYDSRAAYLPYECVRGVWQYKGLDVCSACKAKIEHTKNAAVAEFIKRKE